MSPSGVLTNMINLRGQRPMKRAGKLGLAAAASIAIAASMSVNGTPADAAKASASYAGEVADFYRQRGGAPLWFSPRSGNAARELVQLLATAQADNLNPKRYDARRLARTVGDASRGDPGSVQRAEMALSQAFVAYARDTRHDPGVG